MEQSIFVINELIQTIGLGIAGIDPLGAILLFSAIRAGAERLKVIALVVSTLITSVIAGVVITVASGQLVESTSIEPPSEPGAIWAYLEISVAILIGYWLIQRSNSNRDFKKERDKNDDSVGSIFTYIVAGAVFSVTAVIDPTFVATAVVVADNNDVFISVIAFTVWTLISQFMMFTLFVAYLSGAEQPLINATMLLWQKHKSLFQGALYAAGALAVLLLLADAIYYIINKNYYGQSYFEVVQYHGTASLI